MLFFFGTGTSTAGRFPLPGVTCVNCHTPGSVVVVVYSRYLHFFWVPILPIGKRSVSVCAHCQQALTSAQWPPSYQAAGLAAQQQARTPLTNYIALLILGGLFAVFMAIGAFSSSRTVASQAPANDAPGATLSAAAKANEPLLNNPQVGDLYVMRNTGDNRYSLMQVARVAADTLYLKTSTYRPASLAAVTAQPDSVQQGLNSFLVPMPRGNMALINKTNLLTVVRQ